MIKFLLKFSIGIFLVLLTYDIYNYIVQFAGPGNRNQILVVHRELAVPPKILEAPPPTPAAFDPSSIPYWYYIGGLTATVVSLIGLSVVMRRRKGLVGQARETELSNVEGDKAELVSRPQYVIIKEMPKDIYNDKCNALQEQINQLRVASKISNFSSLYEDVMSQNLIDVLYMKPQLESHEFFPVKLSPSPPNDNFFSMNDEPVKPEKESIENNLDIDKEHDHIEYSSLIENNIQSPKLKTVHFPEIEYSVNEVNTTPMIEIDKEIIQDIELKQREIEERLERLEEQAKEWMQRVANLENITVNWNHKLKLAESELVDLHQQMYTVLTKLEEKQQQQNYLVLSSISKEAAMLEQDAMNGIFDVETTVTKYITQGYVVNDNKRSSSQSLENNQKLQEDPLYIGDCMADGSLCALTRSVGLEAILENGSQINSNKSKNQPKKTSFTVPPHVLPPYKRSSFTATDSLGDLRRSARRLKKIAAEKLR